MKPLIKWPGGKSREISKLIKLIPQGINGYIEPFFGGGAVHFHIQARKSLVNDIDSDLINFYQLVKTQDSEFLRSIGQIAHDWSNLGNYSMLLNEELTALLHKYRKNGMNKHDLQKYIATSLLETEGFKLNITTSNLFGTFLVDSITSKIHRVIKLEEKHHILFDDEKVAEHLETAIRAAYYTLLRDTLGDPISNQARFYFIREFCYGSMFRYNKSGKFNIPYGGINYNNKSFTSKVNILTSENVQKLLQNTEFYNLDFEVFLEKANPKPQDFIFFDPPYDTDFKDYGNTPFDLEDHRRLANLFATLPSKNVMIINSNVNIRKLYKDEQFKNPDLQLIDYEKTYTYNVRGRNKRETRHLLITNFNH